MRGPRRLSRHNAVAGATGPFRCPVDFVAQQYQDFLGRTVDARGSAYWLDKVDAGWTGSRIIRSFMNSSEYRRVVAPGIRAHLAVTGTYPTSAQTVRDGAAAIRGGASPAAVADSVVTATGAGQLSPIAFVQQVFLHVFGRQPNLVELTLAVHRLQNGESRGSLVAGWTEGRTGSTRLAAPVDVAMTYLGMLDRTPDRAGWDHWVASTRSGGLESLIAGVQRSPEYRERVT
jgi:hypothetical protein